MKIPEYILNPINLGVEKDQNENSPYIESDNINEFLIEIDESQIKLEEYLSEFENYGPEKYKLSQSLPKFNIESNPSLIIKALERLVEFDEQRNYFSDYCYSKVIQRLIRLDEYEDYSIEKALYLLNYEKEKLKNPNLYWLDLYRILYDYLPRQDWIELIEKNQVLEFNEYYGYQGISRISSLYARNKGFDCIDNYFELLKNWRNDIEEGASEFHWYKFSKYEYALYGIRSIVEYNQTSSKQIEIIRQELIDKEVHLMPGRIQDLVAICFYLTNKENFEEDLENYFNENPQAYKYQKLCTIKSIDEETLLEYLINAGFSDNKIGELWEETHMVSSFPITDKAFWRAINRVVHFDAEQGRIPVNYDSLIFEIHSQIESLPPITVQTIANKKTNEYSYTIEVVLQETSYKVNPEDYGDYYDTQTILNLINYILFDTGKEHRLIPLETEDQSAIYILSKPSDLIELYDKYDLKMNIINKSR